MPDQPTSHPTSRRGSRTQNRGRAGSPPRSASRWTGLPQASRKAQRRTLLLDTAFDLLSSEGTSNTSVRAICNAARLNPRYFYESFASLDELLVAVYDRVVDDLAAAVTGALAAARDGTETQMRAAIETILAFVDEDRRRGRILYVVALGNETLNRRRRETGLRLVELVELDARTRAVVPPGDPTGRIGAAILVGGLGELVAEWLAGRIKVTRAQLAEDATAFFLALAEAGSRLLAERHRGLGRRP